jgi:hypothetical protein
MVGESELPEHPVNIINADIKRETADFSEKGTVNLLGIAFIAVVLS